MLFGLCFGTECIHMESFSGDYWYASPGSDVVCGLYLIGLSDQLVGISFLEFDIDCKGGGLLAVSIVSGLTHFTRKANLSSARHWIHRNISLNGNIRD